MLPCVYCLLLWVITVVFAPPQPNIRDALVRYFFKMQLEILVFSSFPILLIKRSVFQIFAGLVTGEILLYRTRLPQEIGRITLECIGGHFSVCASSSGLRLNVNLPS